MITPRTTRLVRVDSFLDARNAAIELASAATPSAVRRTAVLLPSHASAEHLRRGFEGRTAPGSAVVLPHLLTRDDWLRWLTAHVRGAPRTLSPFEREVLLGRAARAAAAEGAEPPFQLRAALLGEMLAFYDTVRRQLRTVDDFARLADGRFERDASEDLGAARMLAQARFMVATFRGYERRLGDDGLADEHVLRARLLEGGGYPLTRVVVAVGDRACDPHGLWLADFDLLARLEGLESIDVIATTAMLAAGFLQRLRSHLPGIDDSHQPAPGLTASLTRPRLVAPTEPADTFVFRHRDREEELAWIARRIKADIRRHPTRSSCLTAVVYKRPLPYVYLAGRIFGAAGVPQDTVDALPLASEPAAAALDLLIEAVATDFARPALVALLRSPHLRIPAGDGPPLNTFEVGVVDRELSERRFLGDRAALRDAAREWARPSEASSTGSSFRSQALARASGAIDRLLPVFDLLSDEAPPSVHLDVLRSCFLQFAAPPPQDERLRARHLRAHAATMTTMAALGQACLDYDDAPRAFADTGAALLRWLERQTFTPRRGAGGVVVIDAHAARFGEFDTVYLAGVTDRDWVDGSTRNIFFPSSMLKDLGWADDGDLRAAERAAFADLVRLARHETVVSTFTLEDDALVEPSPLVDDLAELGLDVHRMPAAPTVRVFPWEALAEGPDVLAPVSGMAAEWLTLRLRRTAASDPRFHGMTGGAALSSYKVSALDRYVECPFVFFVEQVLRIREEPDDEEGLSPRVQGRLLHEVFESFFRAWQASGRGVIDPGNLADARRLFVETAEARLATLGDGDAAIERVRFLGSPLATGLGDIVLGLEAERPTAVVERLLEFPLTGDADMRTPSGVVRVSLRAVADRIDLLADGTFRVFDYKLTKAPDLKSAVQLPAYAAAAGARLDGRHGRSWRPSDAAYVAFGRPPHYRPLAPSQDKLDDALAAGEARVADAVAGITRGVFPPRPRHRHQCTYCAYAAVCRKDYVDGE